MESNVSNADGYLFACKLCGKDHEVPEGIAPYWRGNQLCNILRGQVAIGCPEKPGEAQYEFSDFTAYKLKAGNA